MSSIRKIVRKSGAVAWQIDFAEPQPDGTTKRKRLCYSKKKDAEAELGKRVGLIAEGKYLVKAGKKFIHTFGELMEAYTEAFQHQAMFPTAKKYYLRNFEAYWGKDTRLGFVSYHELERYRNHLIAKPTQHNTKRTVRSVNVEMCCLRHMFRKAKSWGMIDRDPFHDGDTLKLKGENQRKRFLKREEIPALLLACAPHLQPIVEAAIHLGTRAGHEILDIRWGDVLFEENKVRIRRGKTGDVDFVPMNPDLETLFHGLRQGEPKPETHVFLYKNRPIKSVRRSFATACKNAGIKDFRFHDLRHTCASHLIMNGANLKEVQEHLGHKNIATTNRYLHLTEEAKQKTANRLTGLTKIESKVRALA